LKSFPTEEDEETDTIVNTTEEKLRKYEVAKSSILKEQICLIEHNAILRVPKEKESTTKCSVAMAEEVAVEVAEAVVVVVEVMAIEEAEEVMVIEEVAEALEIEEAEEVTVIEEVAEVMEIEEAEEVTEIEEVAEVTEIEEAEEAMEIEEAEVAVTAEEVAVDFLTRDRRFKIAVILSVFVYYLKREHECTELL